MTSKTSGKNFWQPWKGRRDLPDDNEPEYGDENEEVEEDSQPSMGPDDPDDSTYGD